jgi:hypothetical protein
MKVAFISPTKHLHDFDLKGDLSFALGHICLESKEYVAFFRQQADRGRHVMLDNGAYELGASIPPETLFPLVREIKPREVYGPDYPGDAERTVREVNAFGMLLKREGLRVIKHGVLLKRSAEGVLNVGCVQGNTLEEWLWCYEELVGSEHVDVISVPNAELTDFCREVPEKFRISETRLRLLRTIESRWGLKKWIHLTGWDCPYELMDPLYRHPVIRSTDSTSCVVHGKFGIKFDPKGKNWPGKLKQRMDFDWELTSDERKGVTHNIRVVKRWLNEGPQC